MNPDYLWVVTTISSDDLRWTNGLARGLEDDARAVGQQVAKDLLPYLSADTIGLFVFPDGLITLTLESFFARLEENLSTLQFLPLWGGEPAIISIRWGLPINTAMMKSSPVRSPTRCSRVRHRLVGPSATAWCR